MSRSAKSAQAARRAVANRVFLERVFSVPKDERATLAHLEKALTENLGQFMREGKVAGEIPLEDLGGRFMDTSLPEDPCFVSEYLEYLSREVVPYCVHTGSPRFIGHMTTVIPYFLLPLAKCMVALHQNLVKIETSRAATLLERQTLGMVHRLVYGFGEDFYGRHVQQRDSTLGILCSGATVANITSLWAARNALLARLAGAEGRRAGLAAVLLGAGRKGLAVFASRRVHYSVRKACDLLGLGEDALAVVPVDAAHRMDTAALARAVREARRDGREPLAVVGVAGSTETGSVDPLVEVADIAAEERIHFHVDAAWGGAFLLSPRHAGLLAGMDRADSVVMDGHKHLYLPLGIGMAFFRDPSFARHIEHEAQYVIRSGSLDLGKRSLEGSRPDMGMLLHAVLRIFGRQGCELLAEHGLAMARSFAGLIREHRCFELVTEPELNILTYRWNPYPAGTRPPGLDEELSRLNTELQKRQRERGQSFVSRTRFRHPEPDGPEITVLRAVLANPMTQEADLQAILEEQQRIVLSIVQEDGGAYRLSETRLGVMP